jgi:hypothetical protein
MYILCTYSEDVRLDNRAETSSDPDRNAGSRRTRKRRVKGTRETCSDMHSCAYMFGLQQNACMHVHYSTAGGGLVGIVGEGGQKCRCETCSVLRRCA